VEGGEMAPVVPEAASAVPREVLVVREAEAAAHEAAVVVRATPVVQTQEKEAVVGGTALVERTQGTLVDHQRT